MLRVLRFGWGLFVVLLVVAGFSIHASNPSQAIPSQVMTPRISVTPAAFNLAESGSTQISATLREPIICPTDPSLSCSVILNFAASVPSGISLSNTSIEWTQADFSLPKTFTVSMTNPSLFVNNQVVRLVAVADSRSQYYSGFSVDIAVTIAVTQATTTTTIASTTTTTIATTTTQPPTPSTTTPTPISPAHSANSLPATGNDLRLANIAVSVLIVGLVTVVTRKRLHHSRSQ